MGWPSSPAICQRTVYTPLVSMPTIAVVTALSESAARVSGPSGTSAPSGPSSRIDVSDSDGVSLNRRWIEVGASAMCAPAAGFAAFKEP